MGRVIELNGAPFGREGSVRPQHVDPTHEMYGPGVMTQAIQGGMLALQAADKLSAPIIKGISRWANKPDALQEAAAQAAGPAAPVTPMPSGTGHQMPAYPDTKPDAFKTALADMYESASGALKSGGMPGLDEQAAKARAAAARSGLTPATPADVHAFQGASAQRSLDQGERTVQRAVDEGAVVPGVLNTRQIAAQMAMGQPVQAPRITQNIPATTPAATPVDAFAERLKGVTDLAKLEKAVRVLPEDDPRRPMIQQRMRDLAAEQVFQQERPKTQFDINPAHRYHWNELRNMAFQMAQGGATDQDRRNLMEAFKRSEGYGVPVEDLSDWFSGEHVDRAEKQLSDILHTGMPKKSAEELAIEQAYKTAMAAAAGERAGAYAAAAPVKAAAAKTTAEAAADRAATQEAYQLGTGKKAPGEGQKPGGMLGVAADRAQETKEHNQEEERLKAENLRQLDAYRKKMAQAALTRARKAGSGSKGLTPYQRAQLGLKVLEGEDEIVVPGEDGKPVTYSTADVTKERDRNNADLHAAGKVAKPGAWTKSVPDEASAKEEWDEYKKHQKAASDYDAAQATITRAKTANAKLDEAVAARRKALAENKRALLNGLGVVAPGGNATPPTAQPITPAQPGTPPPSTGKTDWKAASKAAEKGGK